MMFQQQPHQVQYISAPGGVNQQPCVVILLPPGQQYPSGAQLQQAPQSYFGQQLPQHVAFQQHAAPHPVNDVFSTDSSMCQRKAVHDVTTASKFSKAHERRNSEETNSDSGHGESLLKLPSLGGTPDEDKSLTLLLSELRGVQVVANEKSGTAICDPACEAIIADLRKEKTDRSIRARVLRLSTHVCHEMVRYFAANESLMSELCMSDRGIIVAHLVERLGDDGSQPIQAYAKQHFMDLSMNQSGCIALPRILSGLKGPAVEPFLEMTVQYLSVLVDHPFGNYIVKHFVSLKDTSILHRFLSCYLVEHFLQTATNKFGSHVLEDVLRHAAVEDVTTAAQVVFADQRLLKTLSHDRFANYCVQTMFQTLSRGDPQVHSWCVSQLLSVVRGSPFEQNIMKSAVGCRPTCT